MARLTDDEYAELAADYEANPPTADEVVGEIYIDPAALRTGRPPKGSGRRGRTPTTSIRLPDELRSRLIARAEIDNVAPAELIRRAILDYLDRREAV